MAIKRVQMRPPNGNYADIEHPETDSMMVVMNSGNTLQQDFDSAITNTHIHSNKTILDNTTASFLVADEIKLDGIATNATSNSTDAILLNRASHTGTQSADTIINGTSNKVLTTTAQTNYDNAYSYSQVGHIPLSQKANANGVATLGADSKIPTSQLPALAITSTFVVNSQVSQLALTVEEGDVVVRTDLNKSFIKLSGVNASMTDWQELLTPTDTVTSVNGQTGAITLTTANIADSTDKRYCTDAEKIAIANIPSSDTFTVGGRFRLVYNSTSDSLDIEVI